MSLLHEALKKAEKEGGPHGHAAGVVVDAEDAPKRSLSRTFVLSAIASILLVVVVYMRFVKAPAKDVFVAAPKVFASGTASTQEGAPEMTPEINNDAKRKMEKGDLEGAWVLFEKAVILQPRSAEAYSNFGLILKKMGRNEEAFEQYRKALAIDPQCAECLNNLGVLYLSTHELDQAETQFRKAIEIKSDYAEPYLHLAMLQEARGDIAASKTNYLRFVDLARGVGADFLLKIQKRIASLPTP